MNLLMDWLEQTTYQKKPCTVSVQYSAVVSKINSV